MVRLVPVEDGTQAPQDVPIPARRPEIGDPIDLSRPTTLRELTGGILTRPAFEAAGGTVGAIVGGGTGALGGVGTAGPPGGAVGAIVGSRVGGAIGSFTGSIVFDNLEEGLRFFEVLGTPEGQAVGIERSAEILKRGGISAVEDLVFQGAFDVAASGFRAIKPSVGKVLGVRNDEARRLTEQAKDLGIDVAAADVAEGRAAPVSRDFVKVVGVFPLVAGPIKRARGKVAGEAEIALTNVLNDLAPNVVLQEELGVDMARAVKGAKKSFLRTADVLYTKFRSLAAGATQPDIIPTQNAKNAAGALVAETDAEKIVLVGGEELRVPGEGALSKFLEDVGNLPDRLTITQYEGLMKKIGSLFEADGITPNDTRILASIKASLESDLSEIRRTATELLPEGEAQRLIANYDAARNFYAKGIVAFQRPVAGRMKRATPRAIEPGKPDIGTLNEDELADVALNLRSPEALRDLRGLVGDEIMDRAGRRFLENNIEVATKADVGLDSTQARRLLGLAGEKQGPNRRAVEELVGKERLDTIDKLLEIHDRLVESPNVSQFLKRRLTLGGLQSLTRGLSLSGAAGAVGVGAGTAAGVDPSLMGIATAIIMTRKFGDLVTNPAQLKAMQRAVLSTNVKTQTRRAIIARVLENMIDEAQARGDTEF